MSVLMGIMAAAGGGQAGWFDKDAPHWMTSWAEAGVSAAGVSVNQESARTLSVYFACLRNIAEDIGKLEPVLYRRVADDAREEAVDHPLHRLLAYEPNKRMTATVFRTDVSGNALGFGGGIAEIVFDGRGFARELHPISSTRVSLEVEAGVVTYIVRLDDGREVRLPESRVLHIHGLGSDGVSGYSVLGYAAESIGLGLAAQKFGASFFANGARPSGALQMDGSVTTEAGERLREQFAKRYAGPDSAGKPLLFEEGLKWQSITINPDEAQYLATREFQIPDICRWFRMPPSKVQHLKDAHYNNIESENRNYVDDTLMPWIRRWEEELERKMLTPAERVKRPGGLVIRFNLLELLRGDSQARAKYYETRFRIGSMMPNEVRKLEGENPVDGGNRCYVQAGVMPLDEDGVPIPVPNAEAAPAAQPGDDRESSEGGTGRGVEDSAAVERRRKAFCRVLVPVFDRLAAKEARAAARLDAGDDVGAWAERFYRKIGIDCAEGLTPHAEAMAELMTGVNPAVERRIRDAVRDVAGSYIADHTTEILAKAGGHTPADIAKRFEIDSSPRWALTAVETIEAAIVGREAG